MSDPFTMLKNVKETGKKVVGFYCVYAPQELVLAADALGFSLCATKEEPIADGEKTLPRNFCPLIKSSYGFAVTDKCPYFLHSDIIIGETTCDGKKKMFELMSQFKRVHVMKMPQSYSDDSDKQYWLAEVKKLKGILEDELQTEITEDNMAQAIKVLNNERRLMQQLSEFMKLDPVPLSGQDFLKLLWGRNFVVDRGEFAAQIHDIINDVKDSVAKGESAFPQGAKRIIVTGVPTGMGAEKVIKIIEDCGAAVVYIENCSGMKQFVTLVDENQPPLAAIAEKYLSTPCSCMSPNPIRMDNMVKLVEEYRADGVVDIVWQGCHTYNVESRVLKEHLKKNGNIPYLHVETDYSQGDVEQIKTRVQAFLEMVN
ncbi:MAG TPA: double-cubane-cluster-containing anaerobic reductase [Methylomusa anaerophila]|uniref:R-phenyllactate dehydratase beta subunit n=1 Tax=Methylomusa anaerophila TaxID=1930071 RepID=A0A348ALI0_9FIRM|nr:double-cubane-cluster-containing anaerobic reductase [Methylomusa anaerophila]BBB91928.1 R-phenyllactate dehydratase beta subunit [Methylomusa anaerophila]HML88059.1 double-cubane-cluster-containing anaerobic reductase [Methylomusa anaerophila]